MTTQYEAHSALAFMASMESKMRLLLETGDMVTHDIKQVRDKERDRKYELAKSLITDTSTYSGLARESGMALNTLKKRLQKEGITLGNKWTEEKISSIREDRANGVSWYKLERKYKADYKTLRSKIK